jgi:ABC-type polysaccharide/polyol phosphate transport system ATPase subunit
MEPGEVVGIIGDNGAGKSTILKLSARIVEPTSGEVTLNGRVGALLEVGVGFHPDLTGRENVYLNGAIIGLKRHEMAQRFDEIVAFSGIEDFIDMPVRHYSSGMLVRLGFSVATSVSPDVLLVDEVLSVGDYAFRQKCLNRIDELRAAGTAILYVSHNLQEVRRICDRVLWLHDARIEDEGRPDKVIQDYMTYTLRARGLEVWKLGDLEKRGRQLGVGGIDLLTYTLVDDNGEAAHSMVSGERFLLRLDYQCHRPLAHVVFGVSIYDDRSVRIVNMNSRVFHDMQPGEPATA